MLSKARPYIHLCSIKKSYRFPGGLDLDQEDSHFALVRATSSLPIGETGAQIEHPIMSPLRVNRVADAGLFDLGVEQIGSCGGLCSQALTTAAGVSCRPANVLHN